MASRDARFSTVHVYCYFYCFFRKRRARRPKNPIWVSKRTKPIRYYYYYQYIILCTRSTTIHDVDSRWREQKVIIYNRLVVSFEFDLSTSFRQQKDRFPFKLLLLNCRCFNRTHSNVLPIVSITDSNYEYLIFENIEFNR